MSLLKRIRGLLRIEKLERELDEELHAHLEMRSADNIAAGMTPEKARYDAQKRFGNATLMKEDARGMDIVKWMETTGQNLHYAARMLRRSPGFTTVAILTLALGIGANVATFTVVHAVLLNPLPFPHPEQLVRVYDDLRGSNSRDVGMSVPELWDLRDKSGVFQDISVAWPVDANLTGGEHPDRVEFVGTSTSYFTILGVRAQLGRVYTVADSQPGFTEGITISDAFWHRMFGADPQVLGKKIRLDGDLYTIIGVMPPGFRHPGQALESEVDVFAAAGFSAAPFPTPPQRAFRYLPGAIARLKPGLTVAQAQARLDAFTAQLSRDFPVEYPPAATWRLRLVQVQDDLVGKVRTELLVLFGAVGCVLLIACVNLANLLLARSATRQREIAIRQALGAGRRRLIAQLLTESILLASVSGVIALITVVWLKTWLVRLASAGLPRLNEITLSPGVLLFSFGVSIITGVIFGLAPALQTVRPNQVTNLREGSRGSGSSRHQMKISRVLVTSEIALSLVLLIGAGLLLRSFWHLIDVRPGFDPHHVVTGKIWLAVPNDPKEDKYQTIEKRAAFHQEVLRRVRGISGVEVAAVGDQTTLPMTDQRFQMRFSIEGQAADSERAPVAEISSVSTDYFGVLKTPLVGGRDFSEADDSKGQQVVLVNEALARRYWAGADAVGQHIQLGTGRRANGTPLPWMTIVGVVGDIKSDGLDAATAPRIYLPMNQSPNYGAVVFLRTNVDPGTLGDTVRREVQSVDPTIPVFAVRTMDEVVAKFLDRRRFALELLGIFAGVALLLASIGIYGVMAYTFSRRTNEIGIRMAMGAQRADIFKIAVVEGALIVAFGLAAGFAGSLVLTRFLQTMLFDVKPTDPLTFAAISALLAAVALAACFAPARRATRVDPLVALRHE
jgi:putative ABC transport system permease protein